MTCDGKPLWWKSHCHKGGCRWRCEKNCFPFVTNSKNSFWGKKSCCKILLRSSKSSQRHTLTCSFVRNWFSSMSTSLFSTIIASTSSFHHLQTKARELLIARSEQFIILSAKSHFTAETETLFRELLRGTSPRFQHKMISAKSIDDIVMLRRKMTRNIFQRLSAFTNVRLLCEFSRFQTAKAIAQLSYTTFHVAQRARFMLQHKKRRNIFLHATKLRQHVRKKSETKENCVTT